MAIRDLFLMKYCHWLDSNQVFDAVSLNLSLGFLGIESLGYNVSSFLLALFLS